MKSLRQKYSPWALITGASSGLGAAFAKRLAADGLDVVLVARREDRLRALADELEGDTGVEARVVAADLSRPDFLSPLAEATAGLDIGLLVNNAGQGRSGDFLEHDLESELGMLHLNARAPLILTHHYGRLMRGRGRGGIVFLASVVGLAGIPSTVSQYEDISIRHFESRRYRCQSTHQSGCRRLQTNTHISRNAHGGTETQRIKKKNNTFWINAKCTVDV